MALSKNTEEMATSAMARYYGSLYYRIPEIDDAGFLSFASQSLGIIDDIARASGVAFSLVVKNSQTATFTPSASGSEAKIVLPAWYFSKSGLEDNLGELTCHKDVSIALACGSSVHEGLHMYFSNMPFERMVNETLGPGRHSSIKQQLVRYVVQIFEDVFIEHDRKVIALDDAMRFLDVKNAVFFGDDLSEAVGKVSSSGSAQNIIELLAFLKYKPNKDAIIEAIYGLSFDLYEALGQFYAFLPHTEFSMGSYTNPKRFEHFGKILDAICADFPLDNGEDGEEPLKIDESFFAGLEISEEELAAAGFGLIPGEVGSGLSEEEAEGLIIEFIKELAANEEMEHVVSSSTTSTGRLAVEVVDIKALMVPLKDDALPNCDINYSFLAATKRAMSTRHYNTGASHRGSKVSKTGISRIATDGKVFTSQVVENAAIGEMEIIICVDASGSMGEEFYAQTLAEAKAIHNMLRELNVPSSVFCHTGAMDGERTLDKPGLFHIASYRMLTNTTVDDRFQAALSVGLSHNYDGIIIDELCTKHFTPVNRKKMLIMLSDGAPCGSGYNNAEWHTKEMIEKARRNGVTVISFSLKSGVVKSNNNLYGEKFNIDARLSPKAAFEKVLR